MKCGAISKLQLAKVCIGGSTVMLLFNIFFITFAVPSIMQGMVQSAVTVDSQDKFDAGLGKEMEVRAAFSQPTRSRMSAPCFPFARALDA